MSSKQPVSMQIVMNQAFDSDSPYTINKKQNSVSIVSNQQSNVGKYMNLSTNLLKRLSQISISLASLTWKVLN